MSVSRFACSRQRSAGTERRHHTGLDEDFPWDLEGRGIPPLRGRE